VSLAVMIGKLSKIAAGMMQTHVAGNQVDCAFLAETARALGAPAELLVTVRKANTARHVQELIDASGFQPFHTRLCEVAALRCVEVTGGKVEVDVTLFDFGGGILGRSC
jgi:cobalt-precorrin-5B (C1)-methyltransferase